MNVPPGLLMQPSEHALDLTEAFYDLWDCTDVLVVKKAYEIRDSPSLTLEEKRRQLQALVDSGSKTFSSTK